MTERERLVELLKKADDFTYSLENELADYLLANGVVVLPCKIGDTVYEAEKYCDNGAVCLRCYEKDGCKNCLYWNEIIIERPFCIDDYFNFGKTVFGTREEAEKALKECENNA